MITPEPSLSLEQVVFCANIHRHLSGAQIEMESRPFGLEGRISYYCPQCTNNIVIEMRWEKRD